MVSLQSCWSESGAELASREPAATLRCRWARQEWRKSRGTSAPRGRKEAGLRAGVAQAPQALDESSPDYRYESAPPQAKERNLPYRWRLADPQETRCAHSQWLFAK